jgi:hypothetical protein
MFQMIRVQNKKIQWANSILLLILYFFVSTAQGQYSGGSGTAEDPFLIYTSDQMNAIGNNPNDWNKHFKLMANIDLSTLTGTSFNVIGNDYDNPFTGVFDGNEHTISHLTIRGKAFRALFGRLLVGAEVKDLGLIDVNVTGSMRYVAGLVGLNEGNVTNCYSTGIVNGKWAVGGLVAHNNGDIIHSYSTCAVNGDEEVGGLVGYSGNGHIFCCYSSGTVNGYNIVGGLAGFNWLASVSQCYSTGVVNGGMNVGGLIGINYKGDLTDSYSTCAVIGSGFVGGLVGKNENKIRNCYAIGSVTGIKNLGGLIGQNDTGGDVLFSFWDIETSGQTTSDGGMGKTSFEMQNIQTYWDAGWDFADEIENGTSEVWQIPEIGGYPLLAILSGHTSPQLQGFGTPEDPYIISDAFKLGAMIYHPHAHYRLTASIDLSGIRWGTAVIPWFRGTFDGNGHTISHLTIMGEDYLGLFGRLESEAELKGLGVVDVNITGSGDYVGGLVGYNHNRVSNCYSTGEISGSLNLVGGLVGANWGHITTSYSNCTVTGNNYVGGLVGTSWGHITTSYSTGTVSGSSSAGGFIGNNKSNVNACFWDNQTSGLLKMCGSQDVESIGCDDSYGKTTVEMQTANTFLEAGWDLVGEIDNGTEDIWWIDEGQDYPRLREFSNDLKLPSFPAFCPYPQDGAIDVRPLLVLSWVTRGSFLHHDVYLGEDKQAVTNATTRSQGIYCGRQAAVLSTYDTGTLELDKIYYWRINEVDEADPDNPWKGNVWSFTTADFLIIDDFESYNDLGPETRASNRIYNTWIDGFDNPEINGSVVDSFDIKNLPNPTTIVRSGVQSMWYSYDNAIGNSWATANIDNLAIGWDWTIEGVGILSLWYRGYSNNAAEPMYVTLANANGSTAVVYHDNPNAAQLNTWTEWRINLQEFADQGVDLTNVNSITIGFGNRNNPVAGGKGEMWFDDIRLYRPIPQEPIQ